MSWASAIWAPLFIWDNRGPSHPAARDTSVAHVYVNNKAGVVESVFALSLIMADPRALVAFLIALIIVFVHPGYIMVIRVVGLRAL